MSKHNNKIQPTQSVGSLMDKSLNYGSLSRAFTQQMAPVSNIRYALKSGGSVSNDPIDQEILELELFVGLRPMDSYHAFLIEQMKDRLSYLYSIKKKKE